MTQASSGCGPAPIDAASPSERAAASDGSRRIGRFAYARVSPATIARSRAIADPRVARVRCGSGTLSSTTAAVNRHRYRRCRFAARRSAAGRFAIAGGAKARDRFVTICRYAGIPLSAPLIAVDRTLAGSANG